LLIGPYVHETSQECPGSNHDSFSVELNLQGGLDPINAAIPMEEAQSLALFAVQKGLAFADPLQTKLIGLLVALRPGSPHRGTLLRVEHSELETAEVGRLPHLTTESVYFSGEVTFGKPSNGGIAGHLPDGVQIDGQQEGFAAHPRGSQSRFHPSMASSHHNDIIPLRIDEHAGRVVISS